MDQTLLARLGLNETQQHCYQNLLKGGPTTPLHLANELAMKRTTVYMALERLEELGLVEKLPAEVLPKRGWRAKNPTELKKLLLDRQADLQQTSQVLQSALPGLTSQYRLSHQQPGVLHIEGKTGIKTIYDDIIRTSQEVLILPSFKDRDNSAIAEFIDVQILRQQLAGIKVRSLSAGEPFSSTQIDDLAKKGITVGFYGKSLYEAQIFVYGDRVALSTFGDSMVTTIITSEQIADTFKAIFENMWSARDSV